LADAIRENKAVRPAESPAAVRTDVAGLRSVRSQALRGEGSAPGDRTDDLKRIRGIGVLIEKRLNALGITSYEQVANWTKADIDIISSQLDFRGRIERENWVEQARILASGGQTEFSRRVDRGEVESSKEE
jgi:predicted flap endonuclease-1-like 5' DNA nuclease